MRYEGSVYRPPGEWKSYILQCTVGCSYNLCTFCEAYKGKAYRVKSLDYVLDDIAMAAVRYPETKRYLLQTETLLFFPWTICSPSWML